MGRHAIRYLVKTGWVLLILGTALWTCGYFATGTQSLVAWTRLLPQWAADTLPNLEAEIGMVLLIAGTIPIYWDMWRSGKQR